MTLERPRATKTALVLARRIVSDIERLGLRPGDKLPPERLMLEDYQVGRGTLRESLRFLELQGILSLKPGPGGGPIVEQPDGSNLSALLMLMLQFSEAPYNAVVEARGTLEPVMAQLAAERITPEALLELEGTVKSMETSLSDDRRFLEDNRRFHDIIAWSSGNPIFGYMVDALLRIIDGTAVGVEYPEHRRVAILKAHRNIYEALSAKDADASREAMRAHIDAYTRYIERKFPQVLSQRVVWVG